VNTVTRRALLAAPALVPALSLAARAQGEWRPAWPVRMVVGFAPGGTSDAPARLLAGPFSEWLGQPCVVDNRPGAGGNLATENVVRSAPDGLTIALAQVGQLAINPHTFPSMTFNPVAELAPIGMTRTGDFVLVVHPSLNVSTVAELVALLRREPARFNHATTVPGGVVHVITELFKARTGTQMEGVHFRGSGPAIPEVLAGRVPIMAEGLGNMLEHIRAGSVRALMLASANRSPAVPNVPTAAEAGLADFVFLNGFALVAPRATPQPILDRYAELNRRALALPEVAERIRATADQPGTGTAADLAWMIEREHRVFGEVVRAQNIRAE